MSVDLSGTLQPYGTPEQVKKTIARIKTKTNWEDFVKEYEYGKCINPYSIKEIVDNYYNNLPAASSPAASSHAASSHAASSHAASSHAASSHAATTSIATNGLRFIKSEMLPTGKTCPYRELKEYEKWYFYEDENGEEIKRKS